MASPWKIRLLGSLSVERSEETVSRFSTQKTAALLAYLALHPRPHPREAVAELFWPEKEGGRALSSLRTALSSLRGQLEPPGSDPGSVIIADSHTVGLNPNAIETDVAKFMASIKAARRADVGNARLCWEEAAFLYSGELLPGFYDEWIIDLRTFLEAVYHEVLNSLEVLTKNNEDVIEKAGATQISLRATLEYHWPTLVHEENRAAHPDKSIIHGLPSILTRFYGREREIDQIYSLINDPDNRLVTITGPGGIGKTRLAVKFTEAFSPTFPSETWFIPLADLDRDEQLLDVVAAFMNLPDQEAESLLEAVVERVSRGCPLLIFDNFEHLAERGSVLVQTLLKRVSTLTCLITSRRRLNLEGEIEFPLPPLPLPECIDTPEQLCEIASVRLFRDRSQAVRPSFQVTRHNASDVARLCQLLEGIPLALELAAAHAGTFSTHRMIEGLGKRFDLLRRRRRRKGSPSQHRHDALWDTLAWSVELLPKDLLILFTELSVFRGGFTLEAAEAVCSPLPLGVGLGINQLRQHSLLTSDEAAGDVRFYMLETIREFATSHLSKARESKVTQRHVEYYSSLLKRSTKLSHTDELRKIREGIALERENLRITLDRLYALGDLPAAADLIMGSRFWRFLSSLPDGNDWLDQIVEKRHLLDPSYRLQILFVAVEKAEALRDFGTAIDYLQETLDLAREAGSPLDIAHALTMFQRVAHASGDFTLARTLGDEAVPMCRELGALAVLGHALSYQADSALVLGDLSTAEALYEEGIGLFNPEIHALNIAHLRHQLGEVMLSQGRYASAEEQFNDSLQSRITNDDPVGIALCQTSLGNIARVQGHYERALSLFDKAIQSLEGEREETAAYIRLCMGKVNLAQGHLIAACSSFDTCSSIWKGHDRWTAVLHTLKGTISYYRGNFSEARQLGEDALLRVRRVKCPGSESSILYHLARVACQEHDFDRSIMLHQKCLELRVFSGEKPGIAESLEAISFLFTKLDDPQSGAFGLGISASLRAEIGMPLSPVERLNQVELTESIRDRIEVVEFNSLHSSGANSSLADAVHWVMERLKSMTL